MNESPIIAARRIKLENLKPNPKNKFARAGVSYEKTITKALTKTGLSFVHNPQFLFERKNGLTGIAIPDIILELDTNLIIIEAKLTWKSEALEKLENLYIPIVKIAYGIHKGVIPLVVVKNLLPKSPPAELDIKAALTKENHLINWRGKGEILG